MTYRNLAGLISCLLLLSACGPVGLATGAAATVGIASAKEGGLKGGITDASIRAQINDLWFRKDLEMFRKVSMSVDQGRVLLTGVVQNPEHRVEAVRLAWQPKGVKQVINEIRVGNSSSFVTFAKDEWITAQLRTRLIGNADVQSINYSIETVQGSVYLMGVAQNQEELDRVIRIAQRIKGVKEVISYVKLLGEPITSAGASTSVTGLQTSVPATATAAPLQIDDTTSGHINSVPATPSYGAPPSAVESEVLPP